VGKKKGVGEYKGGKGGDAFLSLGGTSNNMGGRTRRADTQKEGNQGGEPGPKAMVCIQMSEKNSVVVMGGAIPNLRTERRNPDRIFSERRKMRAAVGRRLHHATDQIISGERRPRRNFTFFTHRTDGKSRSFKSVVESDMEGRGKRFYRDRLFTALGSSRTWVQFHREGGAAT